MACPAIDAQVGILVDDGNDDGAAVVEAGELGPVASSAEFYDLRLADTVGCDPAGCSAALTRVCLARTFVLRTIVNAGDRWVESYVLLPHHGDLISCMLVSFPCHRPRRGGKYPWFSCSADKSWRIMMMLFDLEQFGQLSQQPAPQPGRVNIHLCSTRHHP